MSKRKPRRLWTKIKGSVPPGTTAAEFWGMLRKTVRSEEYDLPDGWDVTIEWKNKEDADFKSGDFTEAMQESAESSRGWDLAILHYINGQINRLPERGAVASRTGRLTRRLAKEKRSAAARKGWKTRRAAARRRSRAAVKGWQTRRKKSRRARR